MIIMAQRGIGYCGLACVLCSVKDCLGCAVGIANGGDCSAEVFDNAGKDGSYLHIDLSAPYETQTYISELLTLADKELFKIFNIRKLLIKAVPSAKERIAALQAYGYQPFECKTGGTHYYMKERIK